MTIRTGLAASVVILAALSLLVGGRSARGGEAAPAGASVDSPAPGAPPGSPRQGPGPDARPPGAGGDSSRQGPGRGFGPGRGGRFLDDVKTQIRASDEEWKVIGPKLRQLIFLKMIVEGGAGGEGPGRFGGPPGGGPGGPPGGGPGGPPGGAFRGPGDGWPPGGPMPGGGPGGQGFRGPGQDFPRRPGDMGGPGGPMQGGPMPGGGFPGQGQDFPRRPGDMGGPTPGNPMPGGGPGGPMPGGGPRGGPGGPMPGGGPGGPGFGGPVTGDIAALVQARADLRTALDDEKSSPDVVREKVAAVREARRKARAALAGVANDLLELLTADQEAMLVALGHLD